MKKFRPHNAGYILIYVIVAGSVIEAARSLIVTWLGTANTVDNTFMLWSLLLAPVALIYGLRYFRTIVEISPTHVRVVRPVLVVPKPGEKRANLLFRQGENDNVLISRSFEIAQLAKYGYVEDFGLKPEDKSGGKPTAKLFPLREVAFVMQDGKNCRMNAAVYSKTQIRDIFAAIREASGVEPTGALASALTGD